MAESIAGFGHWRSDLTRQEITWSPQMYVITGYPTDQPIVMETVRSLYHPDDVERARLHFESAMQSGVAEQLRLRMTRPDGRMIHVLISAVRDGPTGMVGIMRDCTEEVEAETKLIKMRDQARAADHNRSEILTVLSHEIRTPMTGVLSSIESLRRDPSKAQQKQLLDGLSQAAVTVMGVVDDMLDYSRAGAGRIVLEPVNFDLKALVRTTADLFRRAAAEKDLVIEVHGVDGGAAPVHADSARVQQLLSNLISSPRSARSRSVCRRRVRGPTSITGC